MAVFFSKFLSLTIAFQFVFKIMLIYTALSSSVLPEELPVKLAFWLDVVAGVCNPSNLGG